MKRTERFELNMLGRDKQVLRQLAQAEGETMSVVVRRLIRHAARERGLLPPPDQCPQGYTTQEVQ